MLGAMHQAFKVAAFGGFSGIAGLLVAWRWIFRTGFSRFIPSWALTLGSR